MFLPQNEDLLQKYAFQMYCSRMSIFGILRGRKKMTSGKKFSSDPPTPLDFFQTSKSQKKVRKKILGSPSPRVKKIEKSQNISGGFAPGPP